MDHLIQTVRQKFKIVLETWDISRGVVTGLEEWRELFGKGTLEELLLKYILPKLALELREKFVVDPSDQKLEVLEKVVMPWRLYFRASTWGQLLESEFFSKWLAMLHLWLTSEGVDLSEVGQWYEWWKHSVFNFPPEVLEMEAVRRGFKTGLDLMSKAADYTEQGLSLTKLPSPVTVQRRPETEWKSTNKMPRRTEVTKPVVVGEETTFRDVLEDFCAENDLLFIPLRPAHEDGNPLFRVTAHADGKGGVVGYIGKGDVLYVQSTRQGPFKPESLDRLPELAKRR
jgi:tuftelin-interacting protein 11